MGTGPVAPTAGTDRAWRIRPKAPRGHAGASSPGRRMIVVIVDAARAQVLADTRGFMPDDEGAALHAAALTAVTELPGHPVVEVGTYCAKSAIWLGDAVERAGTGSRVVTIDHHRGSEEIQPGWEHHDPTVVDPATGLMDTLPFARSAVTAAGLDSVVVLVVATSQDAAQLLVAEPALLFIDGGHSESETRHDAAAWLAKVPVGGYLAIHDVHDEPATGGQAPRTNIYDPAILGGFEPVSATGSLRVLRRRHRRDVP